MLKDLFVSEVRVNVLKTLLPHPDRSLHVRAIVRRVGTEINAVRRELERLENIGLLKKRQSSNRLYYTVDTSSMYYTDLLSLISKEEGLGADIVNNRKELGDIKFAVLSRRFSRGIPSSSLDVDLFVIGTINFEVLESIVRENEQKVGREIHYSVMGEDEFMFRKRKNDQFISRIMSQGRTILIGDEVEFTSL
jgi:DNA-binding transcriptional ArsR family regulator